MQNDSTNGQNNNGSLKLPYKSTGAVGEAPVPIPERLDAPAGSTNYLHLVHSALRGRYLLVGALSVLCAGVAGYAGWRHSRPIYTSEGLVQIHYTKPTLGGNAGDGNDALPMFETYMASQKTLITSRRVIDMAVEDPIWKDMGETPPTNARAYFTDNLNIDIKQRSELIHLVVSDSDPGTAAAAVTSVVNAYAKVYRQEETRSQEEPIKVLDDHLAELRKQIADLNATIREKAALTYGTTKLDALCDAAALRFNKLKQAVSDVESALAGVQPVDKTTNADPAPAAVDPLPEQIAQTDPILRGYLDTELQLETNLAKLATTSVGPSNQQVQQLNSQLSMYRDMVDKYVTAWRLTHPAMNAVPGDPNNRIVGMTPEALQTQKKQLEALLDETQNEMTRLGKARMDYQQMDADLVSLTAQEAKLSAQADTRRDDIQIGSRLQVISTGEVPISPTKDSRPKFAVAAAGVGGLFPVGLAILLYMLIRRYRYADEAVADSLLANIPMLGLLPDVRSKREQPELMRATAHGIHHLRVLLTARRNAKQTYLITSAAEGEGKTSLAVALGMSFAATRRKTLLIDGDFVGQRMTRGFGMEKQEGMFETVSDGKLAGRVKAIEANLDVLPAGNVGGAGAFGITNESIHALLETARKSYDTIVVDSGPILGSLEASMLSQEVDGVILTIARGQQQSLLESAMRRLHSLGAEVAGVVFNRAKLKDFHYSTYASTTASTQVEQVSVESAERVHAYERFGPIVRAVAQTAPAAA